MYRCVASVAVGVTVYPVNVYVDRRQENRRVWLFYGSFPLLWLFYGSFMALLWLNPPAPRRDPEMYPPASCSLPVRPGYPNQGRPDARRCTPPRQCAATAPDRFHWIVRLHTRSSPVRFGAPIPIQCARSLTPPNKARALTSKVWGSNPNPMRPCHTAGTRRPARPRTACPRT